MTAEIINLRKWEEDHPPVVRLLTMSAHCVEAYWKLVFAAQAAALSSLVRPISD